MNSIFRFTTLLCVTIIPFLQISAQTTEGDELTLLRQMNQDQSGMSPIIGMDKRDYSVKGTPLLFEDWAKGSVTNRLGKTFQSVELKYDAYADRLFVKGSTDNNPMLLDKLQVSEFTVLDPNTANKLVFKAIDEGEGIISYMQVLHSGDISVYKKLGKTLKKGSSSADSYGGGNVADKFVTREELFLLEDGEFKEFKRKIRRVYKLLPKYKAALKKYYKKEKLDLDKDSDIQSLFLYYEKIK